MLYARICLWKKVYTGTVPVNKTLYTGVGPVSKTLCTSAGPVSKTLCTGTGPVSKMLCTGTGSVSIPVYHCNIFMNEMTVTRTALPNEILRSLFTPEVDNPDLPHNHIVESRPTL